MQHVEYVREEYCLLFVQYVDELLYLLSISGHGCHVGTVFYRCIMYADDLILLSPSLCSLQFMVGERVQSTKYLGVLIDSDLSWRKHIDYVYNKILRFCGIFTS